MAGYELHEDPPGRGQEDCGGGAENPAPDHPDAEAAGLESS